MKHFITGLLVSSLYVMPAHAALEVGSKAPQFEVDASLAGEQISFSLGMALRQGPVVLYFYPATFMPDCNGEANEFANAMDDFAELYATVIGVSTDTLETLLKISADGCNNEIAIAADPEQNIIKSYDAELATGQGLADSISYVISPKGEIIHAYTASSPHEHISKSLDAIQSWAQTNAAGY